MLISKVLRTAAIAAFHCLFLTACSNAFDKDDYRAYFGGEVINPTSRYVLFCKDGNVIDTLPLKENNTFFKTFDSLAPGLYTFRHEPEYQYVYFEKNDSIMVRLNSKDFDESVVFCGRGDLKNNFLIEQYLREEKDKNRIFGYFDLPLEEFNRTLDSAYKANTHFYLKNKEVIQWSDGFDRYAKAALDCYHYQKKELYPIAHHMRTGNDIFEEIPKDYYDYRKQIDLSDSQMSDFVPYVSYLTQMINNMSAITYHNHYSQEDLTLKTNLNKLQITDKLIKDEKVKNTVLNNIAFSYLLEDQRMENNQKFLDMFHRFSTDDIRKNEITRIGNSIQLLKSGNHLPAIKLISTQGDVISSENLFRKPTVIFCWTQKLNSHFYAAHRKAVEYSKKYPNIQFISINVDADQSKWLLELDKLKNNSVLEYRAKDFQELRNRWAITKIHRTIVVQSDGRISNAFTNLFDANFENEIKNLK